MLVITRKTLFKNNKKIENEDESKMTITVDNKDIIIQVLELNGQQIKLGVNAPREIPVVRNELLK